MPRVLKIDPNEKIRNSTKKEERCVKSTKEDLEEMIGNSTR